MWIRGIDPRDTSWEQDHATYRVHFWDRSDRSADEYEISGAAGVEEVLAWAEEHAAEHGCAYTVHVVTTDNGRRGLIRLAGVLGGPFADQ
ncbi:hypothetical protein JQK87_08345 [Streptomyces sp. G44]|uniref:hypothetical protein n=1 Tax=Streptomyces sp. G44 TaxID=2807632 RepID=UPI001962286E|nr:hypothetical protein [Streptomyces sp. G44]MBM7168423.1 hypothetical protein [Streptomyces sp. G44]